MKIKDRFQGIQFKSYGHYTVSFLYRNKVYKCVTTNTLALDRLDDNLPNRIKTNHYVTQNQALNSLYWEVKQKNNLNT